MTTREPIAGMIVLGTLGAVLCGLALWRDWSPVVWWIGAAIVLLALVVIAWRRGTGRRPLWVAGAAVVGLAVAAVPVVEPVVRPSAEVAWSIEGSEEPVAEAALPGNADSLIITADDDHVVRARAVEDGTVLWEYQGPGREHEFRVPVHVASDRVLIGADINAEPGQEMVALDAETGDVLWSTPAQGAPLARTSSVLMMHVRDADHNELHQGIDLDTGEVRWTNEGSFAARPSRRVATQVPLREWLVEGLPDAATEDTFSYRLTAVESGETQMLSTVAGRWSAGVVGDQLIVHATLDDPADLSGSDPVATRVIAYDVHSGDIAWESDLHLALDDWIDRHELGAPYLATFDGPRMQATTTDGAIDVLDLRDGELSRYDLLLGIPSGHIYWSHEDVAVAATSDTWSVLDLASEDVALLADDDAPYERPRATAWLGDTAVPVWQEEADGLFGREYQQLTALDLTDRTAPELVELGDLPGGAVEGTYAGRVVLVDSEEIPDAADDEPQERTTALHVLAPFD